MLVRCQSGKFVAMTIICPNQSCISYIYTTNVQGTRRNAFSRRTSGLCCDNIMFGVLALAAEWALMVLEPAHRTYRTVTGSSGADDHMQRLLVHWVVYVVLFQAIDRLAEPWCPLHGVIKLVAIIWLRAAGTEQLYQRLVQPSADHACKFDRRQIYPYATF